MVLPKRSQSRALTRSTSASRAASTWCHYPGQRAIWGSSLPTVTRPRRLNAPCERRTVRWPSISALSRLVKRALAALLRAVERILAVCVIGRVDDRLDARQGLLEQLLDALFESDRGHAATLAAAAER